MPFFDPIKFSQLLSANVSASADDVLLAKNLLREFGAGTFRDQQINEWPDSSLFSSLGTFEEQEGLPRTSQVKPGDKTHIAMNARYPNSIGKPVLKARRKHIPNCPANHRVEPAMLVADPNLIFRNWDDKKGCWVDDKCEQQLSADLKTYGRVSRGNAAKWKRCHSSAMERYGNCIAGRQVGPLDMGD